METVWIVIVIAVALVVIVFLFMLGSGRIGRFSGIAKVKHGNTEFEGEAKFEESKLKRAPSRTSVSGNVITGDGHKIKAPKENTSVDNNRVSGKNNTIEVFDENTSLRSEHEDKS
ncbi:hypothetical protein [Pseudanabaena yagii]|uniref:Uncharacterized protein n=1 Tax=Pseudanabaena yagii GIHE-NHR1 TaxID=2722753 RepID=A0ABX1LTL9_9CYAN|nr:hypothetical protein [Pseudanabaena yagii]NMF58836.1 hypothetical protein [Pseudanabaena yagii GIHE-NHR1]